MHHASQSSDAPYTSPRLFGRHWWKALFRTRPVCRGLSWRVPTLGKEYRSYIFGCAWFFGGSDQMAASLPEGGTATGWTGLDADGTITESQAEKNDEMLCGSLETEGKDNSPRLEEHAPRSVLATGATMRSKQGSTSTQGDLENKGGTTDRDHVTVQATEAMPESQAFMKLCGLRSMLMCLRPQ